jgi:serine protease Do
MAMRKHLWTSITLFPLLLNLSHAAQSWSVEPLGQPFGYSSEESSTGAYLGVDINDVTAERLSALKLKEEKGVEVTMVDQDAPAGKAGLKVHDVILSMNGTPVESGAQLRRMIHETPPGRLVTLDLSRDGQPMSIKLQLADRHTEFAHALKSKDIHVEVPPIPPMPNLPDFDMPGMNVVVVHSSARSGLMVENITPQLGEFFGVKGGNGVLIRSVEKGSRAEKAGFRAGDVIVKVNNQPVHDTSDFTHALRSRNGGAISVGVIRDKKEQNLNLALPDRKESGEMLEESLDQPALEADTYAEAREMQDEIARLQPQLELVVKEAGKASQEIRKSTCTRPQVSEQLKKQQRELRNRIERLRLQVRRNLLDI